MTMKGSKSRDEVIAIVGIEAVEKAERGPYVMTNRVGYNGACQGDELTEWCAALPCKDNDGYNCTLEVYCYTTNQEDEQSIIDIGLWCLHHRNIHGYEII